MVWCGVVQCGVVWFLFCHNFLSLFINKNIVISFFNCFYIILFTKPPSLPSPLPPALAHPLTSDPFTLPRVPSQGTTVPGADDEEEEKDDDDDDYDYDYDYDYDCDDNDNPPGTVPLD